MKIHLAKIMSLGLVAAALTIVPNLSRAQDATTNAPSATTPKKHGNTLPFQGTVKAVDTKAETVTVGKQTFNITSTTKITKAPDKTPATLADVTVGATITGSYVKDAEGKLTAHSLKIGGKDKAKKKKTTTDDTTSTNSVSK